MRGESPGRVRGKVPFAAFPLQNCSGTVIVKRWTDGGGQQRNGHFQSNRRAFLKPRPAPWRCSLATDGFFLADNQGLLPMCLVVSATETISGFTKADSCSSSVGENWRKKPGRMSTGQTKTGFFFAPKNFPPNGYCFGWWANSKIWAMPDGDWNSGFTEGPRGSYSSGAHGNAFKHQLIFASPAQPPPFMKYSFLQRLPPDWPQLKIARPGI